MALDAVVSKFDSATGYLYGSASNVGPFVTAGNHQYNMRGAMNYVTGSHAFKVGINDMFGTRNYQYDVNQAQAWTYSNGVPTVVSEYARPLYDKEHLKAALAMYGQDRWTINRLTLNLGIRFDYHNAYVPAQDLPAITFVAGASLRRRSTTCRTGRTSRRGSARPTTSSEPARPSRAATTASTSRANRPTWRR